MHYYQFNIGDYTSHTRGLSLIEDLAYRRLLDAYYTNERPFNGCSTDVAREIGMREYTDEVGYVLGKFFTKNDCGDWINKRAEKELRNYKKKKTNAIAAGRASGKARRDKGSERTFNKRSTDVEPTNNQEPITKNQEDKISPKGDLCFPGEKHVKANGCPYQKIIDLYHEKLPMLPKVTRLTDNRRASMRARWHNELPDLETWEKYFSAVARSKFLTGQANPGLNGRPFFANIDWLTKPSNLVKVEEGKYHR